MQKKKLKKPYNACKNHYYCYVEMPKEDHKIRKYNHGEKSIKVPFVIYAGLESLLEKSALVIIIMKNLQQPK